MASAFLRYLCILLSLTLFILFTPAETKAARFLLKPTRARRREGLLAVLRRTSG
jgi:hypothetical protein